MNTIKAMPLSKQWIYALGQLGWSTLINIINLQLIYFYLPTESSGIPLFITQVVFLGVLNIITIMAAGGRLFDAITDPLIAHWSDNYKSTRGRRLPIMAMGILPAVVFCVLMFIPLSSSVSVINIVWLFFTQVMFYLFLTMYVTPFFALIPEFGHTADQRLNLSTWISITYALGIVLASQVAVIAGLLDGSFGIVGKVRSLQVSIGILSAIAGVFMALPVLFINERAYSHGQGSSIPMKNALRRTFKNKHFRYYVVADFAYFMGMTIIMTGLLYYITILLGLPESMMGILLPVMVVVSFLFYPFVNVLAKKFGKKPLVSISFLFMAFIFLLTSRMGMWSIAADQQAYITVFLYAIPIAFLGILPNAILSDIAEADTRESGINQEGMYFAARTLMQKAGQTLGVFVFALLTTFGKDVGNDLGIRLSAIAGAGLCLVAGIYFMKYDEKAVLGE